MVARSALVGVLVSALATALGCTGNGVVKPGAREAIAYECRDPAVTHASEGAVYRIEIDGADPDLELVSMAGRPASPAAGDVVHVGGVPVVLDGPGHYQLSFVAESGRVMLSLDGGPSRLVALTVIDAAGLAVLTDSERQGLRGVRLEAWSDALGTELRRLDLERVAVAYDQPTAEMNSAMQLGITEGVDEPLLPAGLPDGLRLLELEVSSMRSGDAPAALDAPATGISALSRLSRLRYLSLVEGSGTVGPGELDLEHLRRLVALEHLRLYSISRSLVHVEALSALTELRALDLGGARGLDQLHAVAALPKLRQLDLRYADTQSLAALSGHRSLELIDATGSNVATLPAEPPPALRELVLLGAPVEAQAIASFATWAPATRVSHRWNQTLAQSIACADRIRVRSGGLCHREVASETTLADVRDPAEIQAALPLFYVQEDDPMGTCMCCGQPTIEFWRGDQLVTAVGFHHGQSLRWGGWPSDGRVADADAVALCKWLEKHGATQACKERTEPATDKD